MVAGPDLHDRRRRAARRAADRRSGSRFRLSWDQRTPPSNDDFADAIPLVKASGSVPASTFGATLEPGEDALLPSTGLAGGAIGGTLWYRFDAPTDGTFRFSADRAGALAYAAHALGTLALLDARGKPYRDQETGRACCGLVDIPVERGGATPSRRVSRPTRRPVPAVRRMARRHGALAVHR